MRAIEDLKRNVFVYVEVGYGPESCRVRLPDIDSYSFETLRYDCAKYFGINESLVVLKDEGGNVWGIGPINCILDANYNQTE
jgi:hypothetical protein